MWNAISLVQHLISYRRILSYDDNHYTAVYIYADKREGSSRVVEAHVLDSHIVVSEFEIHSDNRIQFQNQVY